MKAEDLYTAMNHLDPDLIEAAGERQAPVRRSIHWVRWGAAAACLSLVVAGALLLPRLGRPTPGPSSAGQYYYDWPEKVVPAPTGSLLIEMAIIPRWEDMTVVQQFSYFQWDGKEFSGHDAPLSADQVGAALGTAELSGWDEYAAEQHTRTGSLYAIEGISTQCAVAVELEGSYYPYVNSYYKPATLGQLIDDLSLAENLSFGSVWYGGFDDRGNYSRVEFTGAEAARIWELLLSDRTVENVKEYDGNGAIGVTVMSISIDMPLLGYENISLAVTNTGYLTTNLLDTGKAFYLGSDKVDAFTHYVFENCQGYRIVYAYDEDSLQPAEGDSQEETVVQTTPTPYIPAGQPQPQGTTPPN